MAIKRYVGASAREAMTLVRRELGTDAIILSNKRLPGGYTEILAAGPDAMQALVEHANPAAARLARAQNKRAAEFDGERNQHDGSNAQNINPLEVRRTEMLRSDGSRMRIGNGTPVKVQSFQDYLHRSGALPAVPSRAPVLPTSTSAQLHNTAARQPLAPQPKRPVRALNGGGVAMYQDVASASAADDAAALLGDAQWSADEWANTESLFEEPRFADQPRRQGHVGAEPLHDESAAWANTRIDMPGQGATHSGSEPAVFRRRPARVGSAAGASASLSPALAAAVPAAAQPARIEPVRAVSPQAVPPAVQQPALQPVRSAPVQSLAAQAPQPSLSAAISQIPAVMPAHAERAPHGVQHVPQQPPQQAPQQPAVPTVAANAAAAKPVTAANDASQLQINTVLRTSVPVFSVAAASIAMPVVVPTVVNTPKAAVTAAVPTTVPPTATEKPAAPHAPELSSTTIPTLSPALQNLPARAPAEHDPKLLAELQTMRSLLQEQLTSLSTSMAAVDAVRRHPLAVRVMTRLLTGGFSADVARRIADHAPQEGDTAAIDTWLQDVLSNNMHCDDAHNNVIETAGRSNGNGGGQILALVGPTGVGKTTTVAKLAACFAVKYGTTQLGLITLDAYRVAAPEQLRTYGRILGTPVHLAQDGATLRELLASMSSKKLVLIDTCGLSQRDDRLNEMLDLLDGASNAHRRVQRVLLLNAASHAETLDETARAWRAAEANGAILTKLDEASRIGGALDCMLRYRLRLLGLTNGQRVPEDWHLANARLLAHFALKPAASMFALGDDEGALLAQVARVKVARTNVSAGGDGNGALHA